MEFLADWRKQVDFNLMRGERLKSAKHCMNESGLDGLLVFKPENIRYLTGLRPLWWPAPQFRSAALLSADKGPVCYVTSGDWPHRQKTMYWLPEKDVRPLAALEDPVSVDKTFPQIAGGLAELGLSGAKVGVDIFNRQLEEGFAKYSPDITFVDGDQCMKRARLIKNSEELKLFEMACSCVSTAFEMLFQEIRPGRRECEIWGEGAKHLYCQGMEIPQCSSIVASGENLYPLARFASDRVIHAGDLVFIDMGGCFNGMFAEATRTVACGRPNKTQKKIYRVVHEAMQRVIAAIRPGASNREVFEAADAVFVKEGMQQYYLRTVLGHSIGIAGWEAPTIGDPTQTGEDFIFQPGMVFSVEPTILMPGVPGGGGVRIEDEILVTESGCRVLTTIPHDVQLLD
jgi:Xaa-Pro aminopeptidase